VLEALSLAGIRTALFVEPPTADTLRRYPHLQAIGVAGNSRTMSPEEMDAVLPGAFQTLAGHCPQFVHYKVCSTFDSSPKTGSIGRAIDIGHRVFANRFVPVVVGVPQLQRFCVFGNLFARSGLSSPPYRLDRHPTMRHHPVTPMMESDLRVHLSHQTALPIELLDITTLDEGHEPASSELARLTQEQGKIVLFDTLTIGHQSLVGRLLWEAQAKEQKPLFTAGSSGIEYAISDRWKSDAGRSVEYRWQSTAVDPVDRTIVVSGSCSPVTRRQIAWALENGFAEVRLDVGADNVAQVSPSAATDAASRMRSALEIGQSVILHTYRNLAETGSGVATARTTQTSGSRAAIGTALGRILRDVLTSCDALRVAIVGGDTSGHVARTLGITSLEMAGPLEPGAPVCIARGEDEAVDGLQLVFKGGQVGYDHFFDSLLRGRPGRVLVGDV
jgi:uncharacterized protein YgbK (DUF1537 family)